MGQVCRDEPADIHARLFYRDADAVWSLAPAGAIVRGAGTACTAPTRDGCGYHGRLRQRECLHCDVPRYAWNYAWAVLRRRIIEVVNTYVSTKFPSPFRISDHLPERFTAASLFFSLRCHSRGCSIVDPMRGVET